MRSKALIDSTKTAILDSISSSARKFGDSLSKLKNKPLELTPFLELTPADNGLNPYLSYSKNSDSIKYEIALTNYGNDAAINLVDNIVLVNYLSDTTILNDYKNIHIANTS